MYKKFNPLIGTISDASKRAPTVALDLGYNSFDVAKKLSGLNVLAGGDDFYAVRLLEALGVDMEHGVLRLSFVHYTLKKKKLLLSFRP